MKRIQPKPGQESVWDYPRPPRIEPTPKRIRVIYNHVVLADSVNAFRVLETSHPPAYYIPPWDIQMQYLHATNRQTFCEFKGKASYFDIRVEGQQASHAAWTYSKPNAIYAAIAGYVCFYAQHMDTCYVDDELVQPQAGDFYGGWITSDIVGPFKGAPGTTGW